MNAIINIVWSNKHYMKRRMKRHHFDLLNVIKVIKAASRMFTKKGPKGEANETRVQR